MKKTDWYKKAVKELSLKEYEIKQIAKSNSYSAPNRNQNLRAFFSDKELTLEPRLDSSEKWRLTLSLEGLFVNNELFYKPNSKSISVTDKNELLLQNNFLTTQYINNEDGVRQNFIIEKAPSTNSQIVSVKLKVNNGWYLNKVHEREIQFAIEEANGLSKKLTYNDLKVWDATNTQLEAFFSVENQTISINVNTANAVYPITIDPLSTTANTSIESNKANAQLGFSVSSAGDINGDGYSDILLGANTYDNGQANEGAVFIHNGSATGISTTPAALLENNSVGALFGSSVNTAGDINGDGYSDIIIGAPGYSNGEAGEGAAFIYHGSASGILTAPAAVLESNQTGANMGCSVALAGDVNNDGFSDLIVGAKLFDNGQIDEGVAFVFHGSATGINTIAAIQLEMNSAGANFGTAVASAGDVNGDGFNDVVVGASGYANGQAGEGAAFVFLGAATGIGAAPSTIVESNIPNASMGISVASAGDVNGDGYSEIIVGASGYSNGQANEGAFYLFNGSAAGTLPTPSSLVESNNANAFLGVSVNSAGDINGDGYSDIIIGVQATNTRIYYGASTGLNLSSLVSLTTTNSSVSSAGDVNGDGYSDLLVGSAQYSNGQTNEGIAYVFHGSAQYLSTSPMVLNNVTQNQSGFGQSVNSLGDVNGDGYGDIIIGCYGYDDNGADEGRAFVYYGSPTGISLTPSLVLDEANQGNAYFGYTTNGGGDINGDGYNDALVGAFGFNGRGRVYIYYGSPTGLPAASNLTLDGTQAGEAFGVSVSSAGDINHDGFSDILIGSYTYDDGANTDEGRVSIYYGAATGLIPTPAVTLSDANQASAYFGYGISSAGDINGDGYSDIIIGCYGYDNGGFINQGSAFIYYGSCTGIVPGTATQLSGVAQGGALYGFSTSSAGDINGDGFGDIVIGSMGYNASSGRAYVYYGSSGGIIASGVALDNNVAGNRTNDQMGFSVSGAGDINGDGYSDIIVGIPEYNNPGGGPPQGRAYIYLGKPGGVSATPEIVITDNVNNQQFFGYPVAGAGDVNGDGLSDIVVGGYKGSWAGFGIAWVFYANDKGGLHNNLRLYNTNLTTPLDQSNVANPSLYGAGLYSKSFLGTQKGKLVWESIGNGARFSGSPITNSTQYSGQQAGYTNLGLTGTELKSTLTKYFAPSNTLTRARIRFNSVNAITGQVFSPWRYIDGAARGKLSNGNVVMNNAVIPRYRKDTALCLAVPYIINATSAGATGYSWQNGATTPTFTATTPGTYWVNVSYGGCTYRDSFVISNLVATIKNLNPTVCQNQTYTTPSGKILTNSGAYKDTLKSYLGCDSILYNINLLVITPVSQTINPIICSGSSYTLPSGTIVNTAGIYKDTLRSTVTNCDSIYRTINLTVQTNTTQTITAKICSGSSYTLPSGQIVNTSGIYRDTLKYSITNCDSVYRIVNLTVQSTSSQTLNPKICAGSSYTLPWGTIVTTSGVYKDTLRYSITNCDSVYRTVNLTVQSSSTQTFNPKICAGSSYTLPWGTIVTTSGTYKDTLKYSATNCDSVYRIVNLTVQTSTTQTTTAKICAGSSYTLPSGQVVNTSGIYRDTLKYSITNCDSVYRIVNLTVQSTSTQTINPKICAGGSYALPWGTIVTTSGVYKDTLRYSVTNCDSVYRIVNLTVQTSNTQILNPVICAGGSYTLPWGAIVSASGTYKDTLKYSVTNCDSVYRIVNLTIQTSSTQTITAKICSGSGYTLPSGQIVNASGIYRDTLKYSVTNCDSVYRIVNLTVQSTSSQTLNPKICAGSSYTLPWGTVVNASGTYRDTLKYSTTNCDSVYRIVNLIVQTSSTQTLSPKICAGSSYTLPWGAVVSAGGTYRDTLKYSTTNCDSVYRIVNLTVQTSTIQTLSPKICAGSSYTLPWGAVVSVGGIYKDTLRYTTTNCDSVYRIINLTVQTNSTQTSSITVCNGSSYTLPWGTVVSTSGTYRDTLRYSTTNCDSLYRIVNLTVQNPAITIAPIKAVICSGSSYTLPWGTSVSQSGIYRDTIRYSVSGCDSLRRSVDLTVQTAANVSINATICQGQIYRLPSGKIINTAGTYRDTLHYSVTNCDSIYTVVALSVTPAKRENISASFCSGDSYLLPWGISVTQAGVYIDTARTAFGCDSLIRTVHVTMNSKPIIKITKSNDVNCIIGVSKLYASGADSYLWSPSLGLTNANIPNPVATPSSTTVYKVKGSLNNGCFAIDSITVTVSNTPSPNDYPIPNAFTPNNDGKNDCFGVRHWGNVTDFLMEIYNRWGQRVFSTTNPSDCWDGYYNGYKAGTDAYVYRIKATTPCGKITRQGTVVLVR
ncbi:MULTISPECIES: FG-GAP-like repeat-containing protein [unclassified Paraflavitalea]|uniref:FG-GAP-like repeat-containing protein n=1 Tax=unclassified Paraflavitalea TaxID=2798305 RepID=UPI003D34B114